MGPRSLSAATSLLFIVLAHDLVVSNPCAVAAGQGLGFFSYFWLNQWGEVYRAALSGVKVMAVLNPDSGPGEFSPSWRSTCTSARIWGADVLGYVRTVYGLRAMDEVKADILAYRDYNYNISGIFLDEQAHVDCSFRDYYVELRNFIKSTLGNAAIVVTNPGIETMNTCFVDVSDIVVIHETTYQHYKTTHWPDWTFDYPASKFWHVVTECAANDMKDALALGRKRNAGLMFVTSRSTLEYHLGPPSYLPDELAALKAGATSAPSPSPTSTPTRAASPTPTPTPVPGPTPKPDPDSDPDGLPSGPSPPTALQEKEASDPSSRNAQRARDQQRSRAAIITGVVAVVTAVTLAVGMGLLCCRRRPGGADLLVMRPLPSSPASAASPDVGVVTPTPSPDMETSLPPGPPMYVVTVPGNMLGIRVEPSAPPAPLSPYG